MLDEFDTTAFWDTSVDDVEYRDRPLTAEMVAFVEQRLGHKLPAAYVTLMRKSQNGGLPTRTCHATAERTSWAKDHIAITGIFAIGDGKNYSLCGELGSQFWCDEWGYPRIGIYFADCPSAGHDMLALDYRACGPDGEPSVVHVDQEWDYKITFVAATFEAFIRGLRSSGTF